MTPVLISADASCYCGTRQWARYPTAVPGQVLIACADCGCATDLITEH